MLKSTFQEFIAFLRNQGVAGIAIGFLIGGAVTKVVTAFVTDIVNPLVGLLSTKVASLADAKWIFFGSNIMYGHFLAALLDFIIISALVYFIFKKLLKFEKIDKKL